MLWKRKKAPFLQYPLRRTPVTLHSSPSWCMIFLHLFFYITTWTRALQCFSFRLMLGSSHSCQLFYFCVPTKPATFQDSRSFFHQSRPLPHLISAISYRLAISSTPFSIASPTPASLQTPYPNHHTHNPTPTNPNPNPRSTNPTPSLLPPFNRSNPGWRNRLVSLLDFNVVYQERFVVALVLFGFYFNCLREVLVDEIRYRVYVGEGEGEGCRRGFGFYSLRTLLPNLLLSISSSLFPPHVFFYTPQQQLFQVYVYLLKSNSRS